MNNNITSTVAFRSNLQPVVGSYESDRRFLSAIHDPFALEVMKKRGFNTGMRRYITSRRLINGLSTRSPFL